MRVTTRGFYSLQAILHILNYRKNEFSVIGLKEIAEAQKLSLAYLEQLFNRLLKKGLVRSKRGPGGGYLLTRPADQISIYEVLEGAGEIVTEQYGAASETAEFLSTSKCFRELQFQVVNFLQEKKLTELLPHSVEEINPGEMTGEEVESRVGSEIDVTNYEPPEEESDPEDHDSYESDSPDRIRNIQDLVR